MLLFLMFFKNKKSSLLKSKDRSSASAQLAWGVFTSAQSERIEHTINHHSHKQREEARGA